MFFILLQSVSKYGIYLLLHSHIHATYLNLNFIMTGALNAQAGTEAATLANIAINIHPHMMHPKS
mgnify:CR=1 FL=1